MKILRIAFFLAIPFFAFGQSADTAAVRVEIDSLIQVNRNLINERNLDDALLVIQQAEEKCKSTFGPGAAFYAKTIFNVGRTYFYMGDSPKAESYYLKAKHIQEQTIGMEHPDYAWSLNNLAVLYVQMGEYEKAEPLYVKSKAIREKALGRDHSDYSWSLNNLAILYKKGGQYEKAEPLYVESKAIWEKTFGKDHPNYAVSLNNLANLYIEMGQYDKAEPMYVEAKALREKVLGQDHPDYAESLTNLALLYFTMGQYEKAEPLYVESKPIWEKALGKDHPNYAVSLNNMATLYRNMGQYEKAEPLLLETKAIWEKALGKDHPYYATSLNGLGALYRYMEQYEKAEQLYVESKMIWEKTLGKDHPDYGTSLLNLANLYLDMGEYEKAEPLYLETKANWGKTLGKDHPDYALILTNLAVLYVDMGQYEKAKLLYLEANEIQRTLLIKASRHLSEKELFIYANKFSDEQNRFLSFAQTQSGLSRSAYDNTLFYKGFLLHAIQEVSRLAHTDSASSEMFLHLKGINRSLAKEYTKPVSKRDSSSVAALEEKANTLEKELTRTVAGFGEALQQASWQEIQTVLQQGEAAIEFVHYKYYNQNSFPTDSIMYAALVLRPGDDQPQIISLFEEKEVNAIETNGVRRADYVNSLYSLDSRGLIVQQEERRTLYELIWKPLESVLEGIETIYYAPSGLLHRINLDAIPIEDEQTIGDRYKTVQLNSTRSMVLGKEDLVYNNKAVLYGGIQYESDSAVLAAAFENQLDEALASRSVLSFNAMDTTLRGGSWNYLKWTKKEVESIHSRLMENEINSTLYSDHVATEESFRSLGKKNVSPRILHFATHGFFFSDPESKPTEHEKATAFKTSDNPMIRSGLILSGGNYVWHGNSVVGNMEDGILTAYEISQMNLSNTELVVLSACETGLGEIEGNEGVYGLQRAFKIAGAKYLIMSLWQVPDRPTKEFMVTFYQHWLEDKMTIPEAFQKTQQEMKDRFYDPYNWAGFVLVE